jgi:deoxyribodipyrimidine photolyase
VFYNKEFVNQFFQFKSYEEAGKFIVQWIKELKHNPTEFAQDFPALIEKG